MVRLDRVAGRNFANVAVFDAVVLEVVLFDATEWARVFTLCAVAVLDGLALVWASATRAAGMLSRAAMRQVRVAVIQLKFRAIYQASPRGLMWCSAFFVRFVHWSVFASLPTVIDRPSSFDPFKQQKFAYSPG